MASRKSQGESGESGETGARTKKSQSESPKLRQQSMDNPVNISSEHTSAHVSKSSEPRCESTKSEQSMGEPIGLSSGASSADVSSNQKKSKSSRRRHWKYFKEEEEDEGQSRVRMAFLKTRQVPRNRNRTDLTNNRHTKHRSTVKTDVHRVNDGISNQGSPITLHAIYTDLYIAVGGSGEVKNQPEVRQTETTSCTPVTNETPIKCNDIFKASPGKDKPIRTVLTKGVSGIGKTVSVQKFILDWAEEKHHQDVDIIFPLPFRELNLVTEENISLTKLLKYFFTDKNELKPRDFDNLKVMFIFDGLDECRFPLNFQNNDNLFDVTEPASVDVLLTNLIKGNLLPSALIWITSRPEATRQIPPECVDQFTEVRGFNDSQKEVYFRKRIRDQSLANRIITHIKSSRSLNIMCHIPVFCWVAASVLEKILSEAENAEIPKTLTQMFTHFLIYQYDGKSEVDLQQAKKTIFSLGKLAFEQLEKGKMIFNEEDLKQFGIEFKETSVYSEVCNQIFREDFGLYLGKVYSFVHLSVQEFFAALFKFLLFLSSKETKSSLTDLLKKEVDNALQSKNGYWDLYLRFLLGLSLESNQALLQDILTQTESRSDCNQEIVEYIKMKIKDNPSPEKSINLFHCLNEMNDHSLVQEVQKYLNRTDSLRSSRISLSPAQWSALMFVLLNSEEELDEFQLRKYKPSEEGLLRLLPVIKVSRKSDLQSCNLTEKSCSALASVLSSNSSLRELNLNNNKLQDSGMKLLSVGLKNPECRLQTLNLNKCNIGEEGCAALASALRSNPSHLKELDLSSNKPGDSGGKLLSDLLKDPGCKLETLLLSNCSIGEDICTALASSLILNPSHLRELNLSYNKPGDSAMNHLSYLLKNPLCKLEKLQLYNCSIGEEGCAALASALTSNPSHLRELNLNYNKPRDSGVKLLSDLLKNPHCKLEKLQLCGCSFTEAGFKALVSGLRSNPSHLRDLNLNGNEIGDSGVKLLSGLLQDTQCKLEKLQLKSCKIQEGCATLVSALRSNPSYLRELDLSNNKLEDSGVKLLSDHLLKDPHCKLEKLQLYNCSIGEEGCAALNSALRSNSSQLRELNLNHNKLRDSGVKLMKDLLKDPLCKLEKLHIVS